MYENQLALHTVDPSNQKVITVDDIYIASESAGTQAASTKRYQKHICQEPTGSIYSNHRDFFNRSEPRWYLKINLVTKSNVSRSAFFSKTLFLHTHVWIAIWSTWFE